jgi:hypothetical protein
MKKKRPESVLRLAGVAVNGQSDRTTTPFLEPHVGINDITRAAAFSRRHLERLRHAGLFPLPDLVVGKSGRSARPRWKLSTVERWLTAQGGDGPSTRQADELALLPSGEER